MLKDLKPFGSFEKNDYLCSGKQDSSDLSLMKTDSEPNKKKVQPPHWQSHFNH